MENWVIAVAAFGYLSLLFAVAYWGDARADAGRSVVASPYVYALSIAVYCTAWTFFGSVGRATTGGVDFLPIYLGPMLATTLWWVLMRKMVRISKSNRITTIADFVASRYGKSQLLGGMITVVAVVVIMPYIALQLKGVAAGFLALTSFPNPQTTTPLQQAPLLADTALHVAVLMAAFAVLFGTRHIDATERHEGMVLAIAFESVVKLVSFLVVGVYVTFFLFDGFSDIFTRAIANPRTQAVLVTVGANGYGGWVTLTLVSMAAILFLPRQFQVSVVENVDERHIGKAAWLFPLYLLAINIFVLPIAVAGMLYFPPGGFDGDTLVLTLPLAAGQHHLALLAFVGGLSAATGMVIVETIALSTMVCNDLVMPILLRLHWLRLGEWKDLTRLLIAIRRGGIVLVLMLGYVYYRLIGGSYALVTIGLISFAAVAQFAPAIIGGMYWKAATRTGALVGLGAGFAMWLYTLLLPSFAKSGWIATSFLTDGPFGLELLRPEALFGLTGFDWLSHALFWSAIFNLGLFIGVSLFTRQSPTERIQATRFVEVFQQADAGERLRMWRGSASVGDLKQLVGRFIGQRRADIAFADYAARRGLVLTTLDRADAALVHFAERQLAGAIGAASARVMLASVVRGTDLGIDQVMEILDEASQVIEYSRQLETKSRELERASAELRAANERLQELDRLKDDFLSTVTHELRTPLTSIRSFSEILHDNPELPEDQRSHFLSIIIKESERLTRLINQVLDLAKIEAGRFDWQIGDIDLRGVVVEAVAATGQLFKDKAIDLEVELPAALPAVRADRDQLMQVVINLLSNAVKFCKPGQGRVRVAARLHGTNIQVSVSDNGPGIAAADQAMVFEKFRQVGNTMTAKPPGSGLGLAICRRIVEHLGGRIWVESSPGDGATFAFVVPLSAADSAAAS